MADKFVEQMTAEAENPFVGAEHDEDNDNLDSADRGDAIQGGAQANDVHPGTGEQPASEHDSEELAESPDNNDVSEETHQESHDDRVDPRIPKHRLDQEIRKRRAVEAQLASLQEQLQQHPQAQAEHQQYEAPALDFGESAKNMFDKVLDGELDDATNLFNQTIQQAVTHAVQQASAVAQQNTSTEYKRQTEMDRFTARVDEVVSQYPSLDSTNLDTFDAELCERVNAVRDGFVARGYRLTDALDEAVHLVLRAERPEYFQEPQQAPAPKQVPVKKHVEAAQQQPPRLAEAGTSIPQHAPRKVFEMDDDSFEKLSSTELAKMRGDFA